MSAGLAVLVLALVAALLAQARTIRRLHRRGTALSQRITVLEQAIVCMPAAETYADRRLPEA